MPRNVLSLARGFLDQNEPMKSRLCSLLRSGLLQSPLDCTLGKKRAGAGKRESFFLWCLLTGASAEERGGYEQLQWDRGATAVRFNSSSGNVDFLRVTIYPQ